MIAGCIGVLILGIAGGYSGLVATILLISASASILCQCCQGKQSFLIAMVLNLMAGALCLISGSIMFAAYHKSKKYGDCESDCRANYPSEDTAYFQCVSSCGQVVSVLGTVFQVAAFICFVYVGVAVRFLFHLLLMTPQVSLMLAGCWRLPLF
jgi:hypothetical protein